MHSVQVAPERYDYGGVVTLQHEVEGWAVGLRLVALALRNAEDPDAFLREMRGGPLHTQEYLMREVLDRPLALRERNQAWWEL